MPAVRQVGQPGERLVDGLEGIRRRWKVDRGIARHVGAANLALRVFRTAATFLGARPQSAATAAALSSANDKNCAPGGFRQEIYFFVTVCVPAGPPPRSAGVLATRAHFGVIS